MGDSAGGCVGRLRGTVGAAEGGGAAAAAGSPIRMVFGGLPRPRSWAEHSIPSLEQRPHLGPCLSHLILALAQVRQVFPLTCILQIYPGDKPPTAPRCLKEWELSDDEEDKKRIRRPQRH